MRSLNFIVCRNKRRKESLLECEEKMLMSRMLSSEGSLFTFLLAHSGFGQKIYCSKRSKPLTPCWQSSNVGLQLGRTTVFHRTDLLVHGFGHAGHHRPHVRFSLSTTFGSDGSPQPCKPQTPNLSHCKLQSLRFRLSPRHILELHF